MTTRKIAFLGLGLMGAGMAWRLHAAGHALSVYNRNPDKSAAFVAAGVHVATSPRDAAADADIIISMVADDAASQSLWAGDEGAFSGAKPGTLCIECSTLSLAWIRDWAAQAKAADFDTLDAPVTGSKAQAASGELVFIVGGDTATLERAQPVLAAMSKAVVHLGPAGSGSLLKLINNFMCGVQVASLAEALALVERSGLDREQALSVLTNGAPGSPLVKMVSTRMVNREYTPNFLARLMAKDLRYAAQAGSEAGIDMLTALAAQAAFIRAIDSGHGEQDIAAVIEALR